MSNEATDNPYRKYSKKKYPALIKTPPISIINGLTINATFLLYLATILIKYPISSPSNVFIMNEKGAYIPYPNDTSAIQEDIPPTKPPITG